MKPTTPLRRLLAYMRPQRRAIQLASLYSFLNKFFDLAPPVLMGFAVDVVVEQETSLLSGFGVTDPWQQLLILAVITAIVWSLESLFQYLYTLKWRGLAQTVQHDLRNDAYGHVQSLEMAYFEDRSTGGLMAILNDDINQLERFLDVGANLLIHTISTMIIIGGIYTYFAPEVAWIAFMPVPIIVWGSLWFQKRLEPHYISVREKVGLLNHRLANNLGGIATIKSFTAEAHEAERVHIESDGYRLANVGAIKVSAAFVPLLRIVILIGFISVLLVSGWLVLNGQFKVGVFSILVFMSDRLLWPLTRLGEMFDLYQRAMASTTRVMDVLDTQTTMVDGNRPLSPTTVKGDLIAQNITFHYSNDVQIIHDLSFHIKAGQTAAFVGSTGAGKSTLIKLLLRYYDVQSGAIKLDGHDLREIKMADLRESVGLVSQDVFLFHGTVRENLKYGTFDASDEAMFAAAKIAEAHTFILQLSDGYDTIVGERGQKLSGGQRQRISIARAILKDPPVLILDEATSSVDNETEAAIQRSLAKIAVGRTTILIAHRLSTVRDADQIFVLENGRLAEHGKHNHLVSQDGIYATLWRVQTGENGARD